MISRGVLGYGLVLLGGLVTAVLPASSRVDDLPLLGALRGSTPGRMLGLAVVVVGLGLAIAAWLWLVRYVGRGGRADEAARLGLVRVATVLWSMPLLLAPPMFSRDGWSYAAQGEMTRLGLSPYVWTPSVLHGRIVEAVDPRWMDTLTPYGPVPLVWGAAPPTSPRIRGCSRSPTACSRCWAWHCWPMPCPGWQGGPAGTARSPRRSSCRARCCWRMVSPACTTTSSWWG